MADEDIEETEEEKLQLFAVRITRVILVAARDPDAAWDVGEECTSPDPTDISMEDVDNVEEVQKHEMDAQMLKRVPYVAGPHDTRTVQQLIEQGKLEPP